MSTPIILACVWTVVAVAILLWGESRQSRVTIWIAKTSASAGFLAVGWLAGAPETVFGQRLLLALGLCALGDVLLIPLGNGPAFLIGIATFALGHAAFAWGFSALDQQLWAGLVALIGMVALVIWVQRWLGPQLPADMRLPVKIYMAVITWMVAAAISASGATGDAWIGIGALAFAASDLSVARHRFVKAELLNLSWGLPLYYAAQLMLALSARDGSSMAGVQP